ncbi:PadR family transcriptional regulator [Clostridium tyrobutyricum]|jgi:DNA-binding PadR family transcriptional regulator|uniref:PadR family transcriptional regulator n=1 Tax=Clostridium tyrobutyricum TaxID=1519 RepID=UPI00057C4B4B|nr:PadR family transcriptional regulator [Clostridium tyrobutyricum]MBV4428391.1 PadR family transcriptional regulator [Clostridium tyrobutyricum]MBV4431213.1 PadR family transcriptional regulator [Clostridium tyrobutyricum]MBV4437369.1 PadR family transcriptional regulator [Clostridium tyrobutyricum]MBV4443402.1 PadR family transcriptional regulator [Clostridium tyrobutyricum]QCH26622.1 Transcriptional regulator YqjI [Clostridium tyrobutyricum]
MPRNNSLKMGELTDAYYYILLSLIKPKHGYLIMKSVEKMSKGNFSIGPASLYTSIKKLLNGGLIELYGESQQKKIYIITDKGSIFLKKEIEKKREMIKIAENIFKNGEMI